MRDGRGAVFVPSPASGELLPFGYQVIEITGYSDMWGEYRDLLVCKVSDVRYDSRYLPLTSKALNSMISTHFFVSDRLVTQQ